MVNMGKIFMVKEGKLGRVNQSVLWYNWIHSMIPYMRLLSQSVFMGGRYQLRQIINNYPAKLRGISPDT